MSLASLLQQKPEFVLFGGKGGVGKTSCASASALKFAESGKKTLLFSTDPAHSLSNAWDQKFSNTPTAVKGVKNLSALEIDAEQVMEEWKAEYGEELTQLVATSTYLDEQDIGSVLSLPVPGMDEIMGLKKIMDFMDATAGRTRNNADRLASTYRGTTQKSQMSDVPPGQRPSRAGGKGQVFEVFVADTAPTGHTLRLLSMPDILDRWIVVAAKMRWKYRYMVTRFSGKAFEDEVDRFLLDLKKAVKRVKAHLTDSQHTEFVVVTIAEAMGVLQTKELTRELKRAKIPSRHLVVNNLVPVCDCSFCKGRREQQTRYIKEIKRDFPGYEITEIAQQPYEIRGRERLQELAAILF